ncbi:MAG: response regulator, partial [Chloroflexi bacterium]|nr:response regulator [Chloroflexota bacterium]
DQMAFERFVKRQNLLYDYAIAGSIAEAKVALAAERFDALVVDYLLGDGTAFDLFGEAEGTPIVMITGSGDEEIAVKAMKAGATDYLIKDLDGDYLTTLPVTVESAIRFKQAQDELVQYRQHLEELVQERTSELQCANEQLVTEISERVRAEEALQKANNELEMRVEERTAELVSTNKVLHVEIAERKQAEDALLESQKTLKVS